MLDIKVLRTEPDKIREALKNRCNDLDITPAIELDKERRALLADAEQKKAKQNEITKKIPAMKKAGENTDAIFAEMRELSDEIKEDDAKISEIDEKLRNFMLRIPNIPNKDVPRHQSICRLCLCINRSSALHPILYLNSSYNMPFCLFQPF